MVFQHQYQHGARVLLFAPRVHRERKDIADVASRILNVGRLQMVRPLLPLHNFVGGQASCAINAGRQNDGRRTALSGDGSQ